MIEVSLALVTTQAGGEHVRGSTRLSSFPRLWVRGLGRHRDGRDECESRRVKEERLCGGPGEPVLAEENGKSNQNDQGGAAREVGGKEESRLLKGRLQVVTRC